MMTYTKDWIGRWAMYSPEKTAIKEYDTGAGLTYQQLNRAANGLAEWLTKDLGLAFGDRIAVLSEFCLEYVILFAVCQKTGITMVPLNYRLAGREIDYLLSQSTPKAAFIADKLSQLRTEAKSFGQVAHVSSTRELREKWQGILSEPATPFAAVEVPENHALFILFTSGTTGFPRGALYTHKMAFWNSINTEIRLEITNHDHTIVCMPPFHTGGWNVLLSPFLHHGASVTLMPKFEPTEVLKQLAADKSTVFMAVPTMMKMMADSPAFNEVNLQQMRYMIVGGEAMPIPLIEKWAEKNIPIRQGYGLTEVGPNITSLHQDDALRKKGSIGTPNFYVETMLKGEDGAPVPRGQIGELCIKGPMVTPGYWQNPEATAKAIKDGWFHTGDLLKQDDEGYFYVMDRIKNMFISGGENVYPAEVEHYLRSHPAIAEVAIIGVADEKWGEVGKAFVVLNNGMMSTDTEILAFCQNGLAKFKIPKNIVFLNELPKNDTGKIDRKKLVSLQNE